MDAGSNGIIVDDLEWPLTRVSRSRYIYKSNISKTVPLSMTLSDIWLKFQGHDIFWSQIAQYWHEIEP